MSEAIMERDYQELVSDEIVERFYIPHRELKYIDKPDEWVKHAVAYDKLGLTDEDGCIVEITFKVRKDLRSGGQAEIYRDEFGREITSHEREGLTPQGQRRVGPPHKVWDGRVTKITETDGPAQRRELLQTHEQAKLKSRKERQDAENSQVQLAQAIAKLAGAVDPHEDDEPEAAPKRGPGRPRKE